MSDKPTTEIKEPRTYLGDGAYAKYDGYSFRLYTTNGIYVTNEVCLEPPVLRAFQAFVKENDGGKT